MDSGLDGLQSAILRGALDPAAWSDVVAALAADNPGTAAHFIGQDRTFRGSMPTAFAGYDGSSIETYAKHYQFINPIREGWAVLPEATIRSHLSLIDGPSWKRSEYVNDWLLPQRISGAVGAILAQDHGRVFLIGSHTHDEESETRALDTLTRLFPLLRHALDVNRVLFGLRLDAVALRQGRDPDTAAILVLTDTGKVSYANARAEAMLAAGSPVALTPTGRLRAADAGLSARIEAALRGLPGGRVALAWSRGAACADLVPVDDGLQADIGAGPLGRALSPRMVLILSHPTEPDDPAARIAVRLSLTSAEAAVALALADGLTPEEIAAGRGASVHTVRNQIKSALSKAGARRQAELVGMVERLRRG